MILYHPCFISIHLLFWSTVPLAATIYNSLAAPGRTVSENFATVDYRRAMCSHPLIQGYIRER